MLGDSHSLRDVTTLAKPGFSELGRRSQLAEKFMEASRHHDETRHTSHGLLREAPDARDLFAGSPFSCRKALM